MTPRDNAPQTLTEHLTRVARGDWSATAATEHALQLCHELDPELRAWVELFDEAALAQAAALDALSPRARAERPLFGLPLGVKDLFDLAGYPTGCGSARLRAGPPARHDAPLVARLKRAGAIVLGKTVTTHFACFDPPATVNPWDPQRTPGGSSSGSAVAVATGMCLAALGSQTGGSIARPAAYCGVVGWKPTFGRLPIDGVFPVAPSLDHPGPLVRTAADLLPLAPLLWDAPGEPQGQASRVPTAWASAAGMATDVARATRGGGQPVGGAVALDDRDLELVEPDCRQVFLATLDRLRDAGLAITRITLPWPLERVLAVHRQIMLVEIAQRHVAGLREWPSDYLPGMRGLIEEGAGISAAEYRDAVSQQSEMKVRMGQLLRAHPLLLTPATTGAAPDASTTGRPTFNAPFSLWGLPTVNLPMGRGATGLPLSLQLAAPAGSDWDLLQTAVWVEDQLQVVPHWGG